jgi:hypothetical protein
MEYKYQYQWNFQNEWHWTPSPQPGTGNVYKYEPVYAQRLVYAPVITTEHNEQLAEAARLAGTAIKDGVITVCTEVDKLISWIGYHSSKFLGL